MDPELINAIELVITAIAAFIAFIQHRQKLNAEKSAARAEDQTVRALAATVQAQDRAAEVVSFFDPADERVTEAPAGIPVRSFTMADETRHWLVSGHTPEERQSLLGQVAGAERKGLAMYTLEVPTAWYSIEYGLVRSSGRKVP